MDNKDNLTRSEQIQDALLECLNEKMQIADITIAYLAKRAGVGKSTFYRHYKDIYDVYEQLIDGFIKRCESLIVRIFFEKTLTLKDALWIFAKNGPHKDNELFLAKDVILINYSIENGDSKVIEILYDRAHALVFQIAKKVYDDDEAADFGATFILNGNIIPILSNLHANGKLNLETVILSFEMFEMEVEKWKQDRKQEI